MAAATAALALAAHVRVLVPFSPVPLTLQTLVVLWAGFALGRRGGLAAVTTYLLLGACGAPVFAVGGGLAAFAGPTAGYLIGFMPGVAAAAGGHRRGVAARAAAGALGLALIYLCGLGYLVGVIRMDVAAAWTAGAAPFLVGDVAKAAIAVVVGGGFKRSDYSLFLKTTGGGR